MESEENFSKSPQSNWRDLTLSGKFKRLFQGRINRKYYFFSVLLLSPLTFLYLLPPENITFLPFFQTSLGGLIYYLLLIPYLIFSISLEIRRLHDMGASGKWLILLCAPIFISEFIDQYHIKTALIFLNKFIGLGLLCIKGTKDSNRFGRPDSHTSFLNVLTNRESEVVLPNPVRKNYKIARKYLKIYFFISFICISAVLYSFYNFTVNNLPSTPYEESPDFFQFILFPSQDKVDVYKDKQFTEKLGTLTRAVEVSGDEIKNGIVETDFATGDECTIGYINLNQLTFSVPDNAQTLIQNTNDFYGACHFSSHFSWSSELGANSFRENKFTSFNSVITKDDSLSIYSYTTNGNTLVNVKNSQEVGMIRFFAILPFSLGIFLILAGLAWLISLFVFTKKN